MTIFSDYNALVSSDVITRSHSLVLKLSLINELYDFNYYKRVHCKLYKIYKSVKTNSGTVESRMSETTFLDLL